MKSTLGVLVTYHNEGRLLGECLESLFLQKERPDEVLIYDDVSEAPARDYVPKDFAGQIIIRGDVNRGPSYGRNALLRASQSDYIHFHDADDLFHPDWCQRVRRAIEESGPDVVFTEISSFREGEKVCERVLGLERLANGEDPVRFCIQGAMLPPAGTYRRRTVLSIGGYRENLWQAEDFDFHIRLASLGLRHTIITDPLVVIRIRSDGRSQNRVEVWRSAIQAIHSLSEELPSQYRLDLAEAAARAGSILFKLGDRLGAQEAFWLAKELGPPTYRDFKLLYRLVAQSFGPERGEWIGKFYRQFVPRVLRNYAAERGW